MTSSSLSLILSVFSGLGEGLRLTHPASEQVISLGAGFLKVAPRLQFCSELGLVCQNLCFLQMTPFCELHQTETSRTGWSCL